MDWRQKEITVPIPCSDIPRSLRAAINCGLVSSSESPESELDFPKSFECSGPVWTDRDTEDGEFGGTEGNGISEVAHIDSANRTTTGQCCPE